MRGLRRNFEFLACACAGFLAGCVHYEPKPLEAARTANGFEARTLADPGLRAFIEKNAPDAAKEWPPPSWDLAALTLAAFYYHPSLDVARAEMNVAKAGIITAGGRPNPGVSFAPEYVLNPEAGMSPWLLGIHFHIPIETAGKRGYRIAYAKQLSEISRWRVAETGWKVRSGVRSALLEHLLALRETALLQSEIKLRATVVHLLEERLGVGEISRSEVDAAESERARARVALRIAKGRAEESRIAIAGVIGLPPSALAGADFDWPDLGELPAPQTLSLDTLQTTALANRLDVRRALAEYAASEEALQLEVAEQYPDFHPQPGYTFDQGEHEFAFGFSLELPILNKNEGPIAEAEARREEAASEFLALQAQVIGELHGASARYLASLAELNEVETSLARLQSHTEALIQRAFDVGQSDRLALARARLQRFAVARTRLEALGRAQRALGALEDTAQRPLEPALRLPEVPLTNLIGAKRIK